MKTKSTLRKGFRLDLVSYAPLVGLVYPNGMVRHLSSKSSAIKASNRKSK